jgi:putative toxin-antitoxin system antitoxin component (TIGR02293 family)
MTIDEHVGDHGSDPGLEAVTRRTWDVFGAVAAAERWLHSPSETLAGRRPIDIMGTEDGRRTVMGLLARMEAP